MIAEIAIRALSGHQNEVEWIIDLHGFAGLPITTQREVAARHGISMPTLRNRIGLVQAEGATVPLDAEIIAEITRQDEPGEDHTTRRRFALAFGLPGPEVWSPRYADSYALHTCLDVLAVAGPQNIATLVRVVARNRRGKSVDVPDADHLAALLAQDSTVERSDDGRWSLTDPRPVPPQMAKLVAATDDRIYTRQGITGVLIGLGYSPSSANGQSLGRNPLIEPVGPNAYRVLHP